jgi:hypothetical protein
MYLSVENRTALQRNSRVQALYSLQTGQEIEPFPSTLGELLDLPGEWPNDLVWLGTGG